MKHYDSIRITREEYDAIKNLTKQELINKYCKHSTYKVYDITACLLYYPNTYEVSWNGYNED